MSPCSPVGLYRGDDLVGNSLGEWSVRGTNIKGGCREFSTFNEKSHNRAGDMVGREPRGR